LGDCDVNQASRNLGVSSYNARKQNSSSGKMKSMLLLNGDKVQRLPLFGEDTFDLAITIQDSFGIKFNEDELVQAATVRALSETIFRKLKNPITSRCLSAIVFYKLRRSFIELFDIPRAKIALVVPAGSLETLAVLPPTVISNRFCSCTFSPAKTAKAHKGGPRQFL
jgi:hypothetical protein